jgi:hypothetical protein
VGEAAPTEPSARLAESDVSWGQTRGHVRSPERPAKLVIRARHGTCSRGHVRVGRNVAVPRTAPLAQLADAVSGYQPCGGTTYTRAASGPKESEKPVSSEPTAFPDPSTVADRPASPTPSTVIRACTVASVVFTAMT